MKLGFLVGYGFQGPKPFDAEWLEPPSIRFDRFQRGTWEDIFGAIRRSKVNVALPVLRGTQDAGWPALKLLAEVAKSYKYPTFAPFVDTGALGDILTGEPFDFANGYHIQMVWTNMVKPCLELFREKLETIDGAVMIAWYSLNEDIVPQGMQSRDRAQDLLNYISNECRSMGFAGAYHIIQDTWPTNVQSYARHSWFGIGNGFSVTTHNGNTVGVTVPGFHDHPGATMMRILERRDGETLRENLRVIKEAGAELALLEGFTDIEESAGYYPSTAWRYPDQYIDIVAEFAEDVVVDSHDIDEPGGEMPQIPPGANIIGLVEVKDVVLYEALIPGKAEGTYALIVGRDPDAREGAAEGAMRIKIGSLRDTGEWGWRYLDDEVMQMPAEWESARKIGRMLVFRTNEHVKVFWIVAEGI